MVVKVEKQNKRKQQASSRKNRFTTTPWKLWPTHEGFFCLNHMTTRAKVNGRPKVLHLLVLYNVTSVKGRGHKAFKCPNRRVVLIKDNREYKSKKSEGEEKKDVRSEDKRDVAHHNEGQFLGFVRRLVNINLGEIDGAQRENIFHTQCGIKGRICSMIINNGSCANMVSTYAVEKLVIPCTKRQAIYKLQWLNEYGELKVSKQCFISFSIGENSDELLFDVVPMQGCHILLGRPWQYDRYAFRDGR